MTRVLASPITHRAAIATVTGLIKLGGFAAATIFTGKVFHECGNQFLAQTMKNFREVKDIVS